MDTKMRIHMFHIFYIQIEGPTQLGFLDRNHYYIKGIACYALIDDRLKCCSVMKEVNMLVILIRKL